MRCMFDLNSMFVDSKFDSFVISDSVITSFSLFFFKV